MKPSTNSTISSAISTAGSCSFDQKIDRVFREQRDLPAHRQDQGCRSQDRHGDRRRDRRRRRVQERPPSRCLGRACATTVLERRSQGADGHLEAWATSICEVCSFTAPAPSCERRQPRPITTINGSISFGSGAASTAPRWRSPTRTHGSSGPCFEPANRTAPLSEGLPRVCETTEK